MPTPTSADGASPRAERVAEDLEHAQLAAPLLRLVVLEAAHEQRGHRARREVHPGGDLDPAAAMSGSGQPALEPLLLLQHRPGPRGTAAGRTSIPTGPDQLPDWMPETRSGGSWSSAHHTGWSTGISSVSPSPSTR